jgi:hypothetical protein
MTFSIIQGNSRNFLSIEDSRLRIAQIVMYLRRNSSPRFIDDFSYTGQFHVLPLRDENDLVFGLSSEVARKVQILARKILAHAEHFHSYQSL